MGSPKVDAKLVGASPTQGVSVGFVGDESISAVTIYLCDYGRASRRRSACSTDRIKTIEES